MLIKTTTKLKYKTGISIAPTLSTLFQAKALTSLRDINSKNNPMAQIKAPKHTKAQILLTADFLFFIKTKMLNSKLLNIFLILKKWKRKH